MTEVSAGKDSTTGHWEMMGVVTRRPFPVYPSGFPAEVIGAFEAAIGTRVLGNVPASGTEILERLGAEHLATGRPIVYTSADSVFQVAAHEEIWPPERLWEACRTARRLLAPPHEVGRVIARPFLGRPGAFRRTGNRRDFSVPPPSETFLDRAEAAGLRTFGVGKIVDLFSGRGLSDFVHTSSDEEGLEAAAERLGAGEDDFVFVNLVDFDSKYGHRSDAAGFARNLELLDGRLPSLLRALGERDLFLLTADHGCDPSDESTDHTRELVPILAFGPSLRGGVDLGRRGSLRDVASTLEEWFGMPARSGGASVLPLLRP
jgi:phosphopentomutase